MFNVLVYTNTAEALCNIGYYVCKTKEIEAPRQYSNMEGSLPEMSINSKPACFSKINSVHDPHLSMLEVILTDNNKLPKA